MIKVFIQGVIPEVKGRESKTEGGGGDRREGYLFLSFCVRVCG